MCTATSPSGKIHVGPVPMTASSGREVYEKLLAYLRSTYPKEVEGGAWARPGIMNVIDATISIGR